MQNYALGFSACFISAICFGINFFPAKNYDISDGFYFQWIMCNVIWCIGLIIQLIRQSYFQNFAIIGGFIWCTGNIIVFKILEYIGLGPGLLIWGSTSMLVGWAIGYFGLFGVTRQIVNSPALNISGVVLILIAIVTMFFIKPTIQNQVLDIKIVSKIQRLCGLFYAVLAGLLFGINLAPIQYLIDSQEGRNNNMIDYLFAHYCGILLSSNCYFLVYCIYTKNNPIINTKVIPASMLSGLLWAIGSISAFIATNELKFVITFPIFSIGPGIIANLFMIFWYKEIKGRNNYIFLILSISIAIVGILLITLSLSL